MVVWRGGAALRDGAAFALLQRAAVLVSANGQELLLGLLGRSNHPGAAATPSSSHGPDGTASAQGLTPALAVAYWHTSPAGDGSSSSVLPRHVRALVAAGLDLWPMPMRTPPESRSSRSRRSGNDPSGMNSSIGGDGSSIGGRDGADGSVAVLERALTETVAAALTQWRRSRDFEQRQAWDSSTSGMSAAAPEASTSSTRGHGGHGERERGPRLRGSEGKDWAEWRRASLASHGGPAFLNLAAHVPNLDDVIVRLGPVADRDLFGAFLEASFGGSDSGSSSGSSVGEREGNHSLRRGAAASRVGIEVGPETGDLAAQVLQRWPSCEAYHLLDDARETSENFGRDAAARAEVLHTARGLFSMVPHPDC